MRQSKLYIKTKKENPKDEVSKNAIFLERAGFIHKEMAGVYSYLPLGLKVLNKIEEIVRNNMNKVALEIKMSSLHPRENWSITGRIDSVDVLMETRGANVSSLNKSTNSYILGSTHEEIITPIAKEMVRSYKDLPCAYYQIQNKFRNEARAKSGIMRGREFIMKDLYSFHKDEKDLLSYYEIMKKVYMDVFRDLGIGEDTFITVASGGDFTEQFSHEFQTICDNGEDLIYLDRKNKIAYNEEVINEENSKKLNVDFNSLEKVKACEVGNIFPLNTKFSKSFDFKYVNENGNSDLVYMGCYGIGISRLMGVIAEKLSDDKGLVWPSAISPFSIHLIVLFKDKEDEFYKMAEDIYKEMQDKNIEVLFDDREIGVGEKLADSDLIGITNRIIVSSKAKEAGGFELKLRNNDKSEIITKDQLFKMFEVC